MSDESGGLIISGSFDGLLDRIAKVDFFDAWLTLKRMVKAARKQKAEATFRLADFCELTSLTKSDVQLFLSLGLISRNGSRDDSLLSGQSLFSLMKVLERLVDDGSISSNVGP